MKVILDEDRCVLFHGDSAELGTVLGENTVDAIVSDPPAGISFMGTAWDSDKGGRDHWIKWFAALVAPALRALKPGGHALIWAIPRTSHWTATALEDAGFEIRDVHHHIFGCVPTETEILTARGWVTYDRLAVGEDVVQVDERGAASLGALRAISVFPFVGEMERVVTRSTEQLLTPGHTVHAFARRGDAGTDDTMTSRPADAFCADDEKGIYGWQLPLAARGAQVRRTLESADVAALYGWVIAEGHFQADVRAVNLYQNEGARADEIRALLSRLGIPHSEYRRTRDDYDGTPRPSVQWYIKVGPWAERIFGDLAGKKPTPPEWLAWLPDEEAVRLFEALVSGDGSRNEGGTSGAWYQKRPEVRAWFQTLCFRLGYRSTENADKCAVQWSKSDTTEVQRGKHRQRWASKVPYAGDVWCPTVPTGRWVARYHGNVFVTGNTGFPKSLTSKSAPIPEGTGTALKPAVEHWILARKPLIGTYAENVDAHGTGVLQIDACRIGTDEARTAVYSGAKGDGGPGAEVYGASPKYLSEPHAAGRWPAHLSLDEVGAAELDAQSGIAKPKAASRHMHKASESIGTFRTGDRVTSQPADNGGGASRFFYVAKGSRAEKDVGLDHLEPKSGGEATGREDGSAGTANPRAGAGRTGGARNFHPTVKSIALMRWLCRLITPPGGIVLDMFAGSGTTGIAALAEGLSFIGVEMTDEYLPIVEGRLRAALAGAGHAMTEET